MCNWIDCDVCFGDLATREGDGEGSAGSGSVCGSEESASVEGSEGGSEGSSSAASDERSEQGGNDEGGDGQGERKDVAKVSYGHICGKCRLVRYCSQEHQVADWPEHKRVCVKATAAHRD